PVFHEGKIAPCRHAVYFASGDPGTPDEQQFLWIDEALHYGDADDMTVFMAVRRNSAPDSGCGIFMNKGGNPFWNTEWLIDCYAGMRFTSLGHYPHSSMVGSAAGG